MSELNSGLAEAERELKQAEQEYKRAAHAELTKSKYHTTVRQAEDAIESIKDRISFIKAAIEGSYEADIQEAESKRSERLGKVVDALKSELLAEYKTAQRLEKKLEELAKIYAELGSHHSNCLKLFSELRMSQRSVENFTVSFGRFADLSDVIGRKMFQLKICPKIQKPVFDDEIQVTGEVRNRIANAAAVVGIEFLKE